MHHKRGKVFCHLIFITTFTSFQLKSSVIVLMMLKNLGILFWWNAVKHYFNNSWDQAVDCGI